jgi:hypothetical protein
MMISYQGEGGVCNPTDPKFLSPKNKNFPVACGRSMQRIGSQMTAVGAAKFIGSVGSQSLQGRPVREGQAYRRNLPVNAITKNADCKFPEYLRFPRPDGRSGPNRQRGLYLAVPEQLTVFKRWKIVTCCWC